MRVKYKNKRDFYKAEAERNAEQAEFWKKEAQAKQDRLNELNKPKPHSKTNVKWFCRTCRVVGSGTIESGAVEDYRCNNCGARELLAVAKIPFDF